MTGTWLEMVKHPSVFLVHGKFQGVFDTKMKTVVMMMMMRRRRRRRKLLEPPKTRR